MGLHEKFQLQSIDILASMIAEAFKAFPGSKFPSVFGRCYDLKSAYNQFAVHPTDRDHLRMLVRSSTDQSLKLLGFNALPFGAVGSVAGFVEKAPCTDLRSDPTLLQNSYRTTQADAYVNHAHQTQAQSVNSQN